MSMMTEDGRWTLPEEEEEEEGYRSFSLFFSLFFFCFGAAQASSPSTCQ
jgi:hypothetical protein